MKLVSALLLASAMNACGTDDASYEPRKNALCKTLADGTVERYEIDPSESGLRKVMADMGFVPCE